jgi:hypothetical protein
MSDQGEPTPMSDTTAAPTARHASSPAEHDTTRHERFARDLDAIGHRTSRGDRRVVVGSAAVMGLGVALAVAAYITSTGQSDTRDVLSSGILAVVGLALVVAGGAVFVRSSMTEFLRFWMLRLLAEQERSRDGG